MPKRNTQTTDDAVHYEQTLGRAIGARLRERRQELGLLQEQVRAEMEAAQVSITRTQYSRFETGETLPRASEIIALMQALQVSCAWILFGEAGA